MSPRQRRGLVLLAVAAAFGLLVFVSVFQYTAEVSSQLGPRRPVLVAVRELPPYQRVDARDLEVRSVPEVFAPPAALRSAEDVDGRVPMTPLPAGTVVQGHDLVDVPAVPDGQREVVLSLGVEASLAGTLAPRDRVDVVMAPRRDRDTAPLVFADVPVIKAATAGDEAVVHLVLPRDQAVQLAGARAAGLQMSITRLSPTEP